jgi:Ran GTPase-activating protein (RanGAP) involved in mRNA processing and transport
MQLMVGVDDRVRRDHLRDSSSAFHLVKDLCDEIKQCKNLKALRLEGNTINEEAATAIGKALEKHSEIEVR